MITKTYKTTNRFFRESSNFGKLIIIIGILIGIPLMVLPFYMEEVKYAASFLIPSLLSIIIGAFLCIVLKRDDNETQWMKMMQYSQLTVLFAWIYGFIAGALPFVLSGQLTFVQALFEAVSGWTTTGLSVMNVEETPAIFLFHRSFMQFCGGLGFVMVMVMFIQGKQAMNLFSAEGHPDKLMPNLKKTARITILMFTALLALGTLVYVILGMPILDSMLHAMSSLSTGGFSTQIDSIGAYKSLGIEAWTIFLMIIGTTNFAVLLLIMKGKFKQVMKISEVRFMWLVIIVFTTLVSFSLFYELYRNLGESIRIAIFNVVSALSTTGYSTVTYANWPSFSIGILILLMLIGGGIGSTAGGLKLTRVYLMLRTAQVNFIKRMSPIRKVTSPFYFKAQGKASIDKDLVEDNMGFITFYMLLYIMGVLILSITAESSLVDAMFEFASALGTVGLSIGITTPDTNNASLIVMIVGMILGRLEIFIVFIGVHSGATLLIQKIRNSRYNFNKKHS
jgi:trk system potassium uptake protein TrkH